LYARHLYARHITSFCTILHASAHDDGDHHPHLRPPESYADFTSPVWITYRTHFHLLRDSSLTVLEHEQAEAAVAAVAAARVATSISLVARWREGLDERCRLGLYATNGPIVTCDSAHTSTSRARLAVPPSTRVYRRLCDLHPNLDVVFRFSVHAVSV